MNPPLRRHDATEWLPAERLGQLDVDARTRPWLIGKGLITLRMKEACGDRFASRLLGQWTGLLTDVHRASLRVGDSAGLFRNVELCCAEQVWVFAETVIPDSTLCAHPWLAELGDTSLSEFLSELSGVERSSYEYAHVPAQEPLAARALHGADIAPAGLWARRSRVQFRGTPLLSHEVFLPSMGRIGTGS
jgi:chorismate lyase